MVRRMSDDHLSSVRGRPVLLCSPEGPPVDLDGSMTDVIGEALGLRAEIVVVPVERLSADFFQLKTGVAGAFAQKFVNYDLRLAVVGDIEPHLAASTSFGDFVAETNRGTQLWFTPTFEDFAQRLDA
jgi:hypothetical protein